MEISQTILDRHYIVYSRGASPDPCTTYKMFTLPFPGAPKFIRLWRDGRWEAFESKVLSDILIASGELIQA